MQRLLLVWRQEQIGPFVHPIRDDHFDASVGRGKTGEMREAAWGGGLLLPQIAKAALGVRGDGEAASASCVLLLHRSNSIQHLVDHTLCVSPSLPR